MKLYKFLANNLFRIDRMTREGRTDYAARVKDDVEAFVKSRFPSGSGFDMGTKLVWDKSHPEQLEFKTAFHHMDGGGFYSGWTEHHIIVKPSLLFDIDIRISGKNRNEIKDHIHEVFNHVLMCDEDFKYLV